MKLTLTRFAGALVLVSTFALATPAYAFSLTGFLQGIFGAGAEQAAVHNAASVGDVSSTTRPRMNGDSGSSTPRIGDTGGRGRTLVQCIRAAEALRNTAIHNAQVAFQAAQKVQTGGATSTQAVASRTTYKAAVQSAQGTYSNARKACLSASHAGITATSTQQ